MITADRIPVNTDARKVLTRGEWHKIKTIEQALEKFGSEIASDSFKKFVRKRMEDGCLKLKFELLIRKSRSPGFAVVLIHDPDGVNRQCGAFIELL